METHKNQLGFSVEKNSFSDEGDGVIKFNKGQTIIDGTEMWNGARYDIKTMDISQYKNLLTADHSMSITEIIGEVFGESKGRNRVSIDGIRFAVKQNALARFAYDMMLGGFLKDFSIESTGPWPDEEGIYRDSKLVGLSAVVVGNNKSATINSPAFQEFAMNSIKHSKEQGLDTALVEKVYLDHNFNPSKNHMSDEPTVGQPVETPVETPAPVAARPINTTRKASATSTWRLRRAETVNESEATSTAGVKGRSTKPPPCLAPALNARRHEITQASSERRRR